MKKAQPKQITGLRTVVVSSLVSLGDILLSLLAAVITGSGIMLAQALQGTADLITTLFLLLGISRSHRKANVEHPFGFGRELFFWVLLSSLFAFLVSGGLATGRAIHDLINGSELTSLPLAIGLLSFGFLTNGYSLSNSIRRLSGGAKDKSFWSYIRHSSLVETKMTLLVDFMGTLSAFLGVIALILAEMTGNTTFDAVGALIIGLLTAAGALFVIIDLHDLIVGRSPGPYVIEAIRKNALKVKNVNDVLDLRATTIGSGKLLVILEVHFVDGLTTDEIEEITDLIKATVMKAVPEVDRVQVEAETPD